MEAKEGHRHISSLDGVRGLAVLLVMLFHAWLFPIEMKIAGGPLPIPLEAVVKHGGLGVDLFFVLSGFLITGVLLRTRKDQGYFRNFYARRALRIFPLYYGALLFWAVVYHFWHEPLLTMGTSHFWPWVLTFTTNILIAHEGAFAALPKSLHHFWTLAIEEQFYLLWPVTVLLLSRRALALACLFIISLSPTLRYLWSADGWIQGYLSTFARFDGLATGAILAILFEHMKPRHAVLLMLIGAESLLLIWDRSVIVNRGWLENSAMNFVAAGLIAVSSQTRFGKGILNQGWLTYLGRRSYGLYVIHQPLTVAVMLLPIVKGLPSLMYLPIPFLSIPLAELSWRVLEKPCLNLKAHFSTPERM